MVKKDQSENQGEIARGKRTRIQRNAVLSKRIGEKMKCARKVRKLSQRVLADILNISHQQIQKYETGQNLIAASDLIYLCQRLDIPYNEILGICPTNARGTS